MRHSNGDGVRIFSAVCGFIYSVLWFIRAFTVAQRPMLNILVSLLFLILALRKLLKKPNKKDE